MQLTFQFESPEGKWTALAAARLLCDIQHLCLMAMYLVDDDVLEEYDVFAPRSQEYKFMIEADLDDPGRRRLDFYAVQLWTIQYRSPPEIQATMGHKVEASKFKAVLNLFKNIILFEQQRKKGDAEAELIRQKAIAESLKNMERALDLSKKIKDPNERRMFLENALHAIKPFTDGSHPQIRDMTVGY